ncbi:hypothetical protein [Allocoleopsis franciscana]|uniref:hypothetical protein n=1 Tax=Allocoleopsis franciscana TaxID=2886352 RepID=UPI0012DDF0D2|nr:hypothetical protein [Allocoleopsis franciscana]
MTTLQRLWVGMVGCDGSSETGDRAQAIAISYPFCGNCPDAVRVSRNKGMVDAP